MFCLFYFRRRQGGEDRRKDGRVGEPSQEVTLELAASPAAAASPLAALPPAPLPLVCPPVVTPSCPSAILAGLVPPSVTGTSGPLVSSPQPIP